MLDFLITYKWRSLAVLVGIAVLIGLTSYWAERNAASASSDLLAGRYQVALKKYKRDAEKGNASAQNSLGNMYYLGLGVQRDYEKAALWYETAAINNNKPALINMGILYFRGEGVKRDLLKSYAWFRLGQKAGRENAETHLMYLSGINLLTPNMIQQAKVLYHDVASLTKKEEAALKSFERQPHLPTTEDDARIR